ncbi:DHH family phosphoesterase, partial [Patescibacteria group bacterium]|nr:DHH family phosphoesterase [Patescibacteria group bacterium]
MEIKNLKKAAKRILKAIKNKEKIILYGDADLDGTTSVIVLKEAIKTLGGKIETIYFPDREKEGYGISKEALYYLKERAPALLIALDCGISNFKEILLAKKFGFEVIVIDHHEILDKLPDAEIVVDPKQKGDKSPLKYLATVGITYKLSELLFSNKMDDQIKKNFLELVALGTIADVMPRKDENKI